MFEWGQQHPLSLKVFRVFTWLYALVYTNFDVWRKKRAWETWPMAAWKCPCLPESVSERTSTNILTSMLHINVWYGTYCLLPVRSVNKPAETKKRSKDAGTSEGRECLNMSQLLPLQSTRRKIWGKSEVNTKSSTKTILPSLPVHLWLTEHFKTEVSLNAHNALL